MTELAEPSRHLDFASVFNLRDLGGYRTGDGRTVRWRTVFRADGVHRLAPEAWDELGIRTVLDLRTEDEIAERGRAQAADADWHHLPVLQEIWDPAWFEDGMDAARFLADRYLSMLEEGRESLGRALRLLASAERVPALFHCAAGKDRTGVLAALLLALLGVDEATIAADYGLSRAGMDRMLAFVLELSPENASAMTDQPKAFLDAPDHAMHLFFADLRARYDSVEAYAHSIGAGSDTVEALRANLLQR